MISLKSFLSVWHRCTGAVHNARYILIRSLHSTPEEFLLKYSSNLSPQLVSSYVTEQGDPELAYRLFSLAPQHNGYKHTRATYNAIIHALCQAKDIDLLEKLLIDMKEESSHVRESTFGFMLRAMSKEGMLQETSSLFNRMADFGCKPTPIAYKAVLNALVNAGNMEEALRVFTAMRDANVYPDSMLVGMLTSGLCKANKVNEALKVVESVVEVPGSIDTVTLSGVVGCLCKAGRLSDAHRFLENVKAFKVAPNAVTYNKLMGGFCTVDKVDDAVKLLEKMSEDSIKPTVVTLNTLLGGLSKQSRIDEALWLFERMSSTVEADARTFNIMVHALCAKKRFTEACMLVSEMNRKNLIPTVHTYTAIVHGLFQLGKVEGAWQVLNDMKKVGVIADTMFYNEFMIGLCKANRVDDARRMLVRMTEDGCHPSKHTCSLIINGLCKVNRISEAMDFGQDMIKSSCEMDIVCWNPILERLCRSGKTEEAFKLVDSLSEHGWVPIRSTYNCMLKGLCVAKKLDEVRKFMVDMKKNGIAADMVTYAALIDSNAHCVPGTVDLFRPLIEGNVVLQLGRYITLIDGLFQTGEVEFALKVFEVMIRVGCITPNTSTFNALIDGLCKNNNLHEAEQFFQKMRDYGCAPDTITYTVLMHGLCNAGDYDAVDSVYKEMQAGGCQPDVVMYGVLLNAFSSGGKFKEMYRVLDDMRVQGCPPNEIVLRSVFQNLSHKDIKRVNKYIKQAFGISYTPEVSASIKPITDKSTTQTSLSKVQDEENTQLIPDVENIVADMGNENTSRVSVHSRKGSSKVLEERSQQVHTPIKSTKAERQKGLSKPSSSRVKNQDAKSSPHYSVRRISCKVPKDGEAPTRQLRESKKSVVVRKQEGTKSSRSSARMGSKVSEGELCQAQKLKKKAVGDVSKEDTKRPCSSSGMKVSKEGKVGDGSQENTKRPHSSSKRKVFTEERVHQDLKGPSAAKACARKIPKKAQTGETQKAKQKHKK